MKTRLILVILLNSLIASAQQNVKLQVISESDRRAIPAVDIILVNKKDTSYVVDF